jgi:hypothetical protein
VFGCGKTVGVFSILPMQPTTSADVAALPACNKVNPAVDLCIIDIALYKRLVFASHNLIHHMTTVRNTQS